MNTMSVKNDLDALKKVQVLDKEIYELGLFLAQKPDRIKQLEQAFEIKKAHLNQLEEEIKKCKLAVKEKELDLGKKDAEINKFNGQLSQVKTNKEYTAILHEIASQKADKSILEEKILLDWDSVEQFNRECAAEKKRLADEEAKFNQEKKLLEDEAVTSQARMTQLKNERVDFLKPVTPEVKDLYEKILSKREGVALVRLDNENCGGCQVLIRPQILNEVRLLESITVCESCSRILYYES